MRALAALAALVLAALAPAAGEEAAPPQGRIWKGTLGTQAITACFGEEYTRDGLYYSDEARVPLRLVAREESDRPTFTETAGREDETGAAWELEPGAGDTLTGTWRKGDRAVPIRLTAVPVRLPPYGSACETSAFLDPLLGGGVVRSERAALEGTAYTALAYQGPERAGLDGYIIASFELDPLRPGDAAINRALAAALPDGTAAHAMGQCLGQSLPTGISGSIEEARVPVLLTGRWLTVRHAGSAYCGGAHPSHFSTLTVFDRGSGQEVDPASWFSPGVLLFYEWDPEPGQPLPIAGLSQALLRAVLARFPDREDRAECLAMAGEGMGWQIGLAREGPLFVPQFPHVAFACTEEIMLPWVAARPFLSPEGLAVMASLR
ncbi:MAG: hypothetical protein KatS3mg120_0626 [Erythrobacter sp.]|nr:MAG: hypothetical protein KatS3mg120_0626 [Erythrobacter sp.]